MSDKDLRVINKDTCPDSDNVITNRQCNSCKHYGRFEMYYDQPCIICNYIRNQKNN